MKHRDYSNDKIYRIIGGVRCKRIDEHGNFKCLRRAALAQVRHPLEKEG